MNDREVAAEWLNRCHFGDCLKTLRRMPDGFVHTCVTSPPYFGLRDYGHAEQIGLEETPEQFIAKLIEVFREVRRVLRDDGTAWVNMGDSYASDTKGSGGTGRSSLGGGEVDSRQKFTPRKVQHGVKQKDLIGIPWALAFALRADGWYLRQDIIWHKPNPMPESVTDRCTKSHEYIFLLSKSATYHCDMAAIKEPATDGKPRSPKVDRWDGDVKHATKGGFVKNGTPAYEDRNKRSVWTVSTKPYAGAHFATFPTDLIEPCVLAGAPVGGVVLDPFFGSGTTGEVAQNLGRQWIGCELNPAYEPLQRERLRQPGLMLEAA